MFGRLILNIFNYNKERILNKQIQILNLDLKLQMLDKLTVTTQQVFMYNISIVWCSAEGRAPTYYRSQGCRNLPQKI